jgi:hypothetical protein
MKFFRHRPALWFRPVWLIGLIVMAGLASPGRAAEAPAVIMDASQTSGWNSNYGVGSWIWAAETRDRQECRFWRSFTIPEGTTIQKAFLRITADNSYTVGLDGREFGRGSDWRSLIEYDVTALLKPGEHMLTVHGFNDFDKAGIVAGLQINLTDGHIIQIGTDESWRVVPLSERRWEKNFHANSEWKPAKVIVPFMSGDWRSPGYRIFLEPPTVPSEEPFWRAEWFQITLALTCGACIIICLYLASRLVLQSQRQTVVKRERARIAMDLHDGLTGGLNRLVLLAETARHNLAPESDRWQHLTQVCEHTRSLIQTTNETIWLINSKRDSIRDFASYVVKYAETFFQPTPIRCRFDIEQDLPSFHCDVGTRRNLFLAVKESVNNVLRHSGAAEVQLAIKLREGRLRIEVADNGRGFDAAVVGTEGNGLGNMRQRARDAGGECHIVSEPEKGCWVEFTVPLNPSRWHGFGRNPEKTQPAPQPTHES